MRPLVRVRRATPFDPGFLGRSPLLWPLEGAAVRLGRCEDFPGPDALGQVFAGPPPVRFVPLTPRRRGQAAPDAATLYDGRITLEGCVPTRARCWHDLMNALVWGTFPRAKLALHARQYRAIAAQIEPGARTLPGVRTRELDALALIDEGGVVVLADDPERTRLALRAGPGALREAVATRGVEAVTFGHAIFESLVLGVSPAAVAAVVLPRGAPDAGADRLGRVDAALTMALGDPARFGDPRDVCRVDVAEARPLTEASPQEGAGGDGVTCP